MDFQVLGPVAVCTPAGHVDAGPLRQRAVLAALLVDCGQPVPVDVLVERVWGTDAPERAARTLHTYITRVRRVVEPAHLDRRPDGYLLRVDPDRVDLHRFHRLVRQAADASGDEVRRLDLLREAVGLWRGQPLAGIDGEWAARMRRSWDQQRLDAVVAWGRAELCAGDPAAVCGPFRELAEEHPLVEPLVEVLMRALAASGRTAEALECYAAFRHQLADELGVDPGPELQAAHVAVLRGAGTPAVGTPAVGTPAAVPPAVAGPAARPPRGTARTARSADLPLSRGLAVLSCLVIAVVAMLGVGYSAHLHSRVAFALAVAGLLVSAAAAAALALPYRWPADRRLTVAGVAGLVGLVLAVLPPIVVRGGRPDPPGAAGHRGGPAVRWARTVGRAPLFASSGQLIRTLPANSTVKVTCRYAGNAPRPWRTDGTEYHVVTPGNGHIPGPYLNFGGTPARGLPACPSTAKR